MLCNTASLQQCSDRRSPCGTDGMLQTCQLWSWNDGGWVTAMPIPTPPLHSWRRQRSFASSSPVVSHKKIAVPFSLCTRGTQGSIPQGDLDLRCFGEILGKWHVLWEPIPAPSRDGEFPWGLCVLQLFSISSTDIPQIGKILFLKYTFWGIFLC